MQYYSSHEACGFRCGHWQTTRSCYVVLHSAGGRSALRPRKNEVSRRYASPDSNGARVHSDCDGNSAELKSYPIFRSSINFW